MFDTIVQLGVIADKYQLEPVLRPWVAQWARKHQRYMLHWHMLVSWFFLAWVFQWEDVFERVSRELTWADVDFADMMEMMPSHVSGTFPSALGDF